MFLFYSFGVWEGEVFKEVVFYRVVWLVFCLRRFLFFFVVVLRVWGRGSFRVFGIDG